MSLRARCVILTRYRDAAALTRYSPLRRCRQDCGCGVLVRIDDVFSVITLISCSFVIQGESDAELPELLCGWVKLNGVPEDIVDLGL